MRLGRARLSVRFLPLVSSLALLEGQARASTGSVESAPPVVEEPAVAGGEPAQLCEFASVVDFGGCTGTLVHPGAILTAAHCGFHQSVGFGEARDEAQAVGVEQCIDHPTLDAQLCLLSTEVHGVPITPIARGCELETVDTGSSLLVVGFGATRASVVDGMPVIEDDGEGRKRFASMRVAQVLADAGLVQLTDAGGANACFGDSGGPVFTRTEDGELRVAAIVRGGNVDPGDCGDISDATLLAAPVTQWFEEASGLDLTPCFDDAGQWEPTPQCAKLGAVSEAWAAASPTWADGCASAYAVEYSSSCGEPFGGGEAPDPETETGTETTDDSSTGASAVGEDGACVCRASRGRAPFAGLLLALLLAGRRRRLTRSARSTPPRSQLARRPRRARAAVG